MNNPNTTQECDHYWVLETDVDESACPDGFPPVKVVFERCMECPERRELDQDFSPPDDDDDREFVELRPLYDIPAEEFSAWFRSVG